jgi:hypothetical protein
VRQGRQESLKNFGVLGVLAVKNTMYGREVDGSFPVKNGEPKNQKNRPVISGRFF